ncbi:unnamed protein product [Dovyalis caffra]|uniref:Uncharacterized protein n=1 Tax=Dovyalis caffra TaxID=77055 RepID=A0AAV1QVY8_9ROSI|nr:unnamed protein product [Dovyalis caffra]
MSASKTDLKLLLVAKRNKVIFAEAGKLCRFPSEAACFAFGYCHSAPRKINNDHPGFVSDIQNSVCSNCRSRCNRTRYMNQEVKVVDTNSSTSTDRHVKFVATNCSTPTDGPTSYLGDRPTSDQGGYVKGSVRYMVTDDLSVSPIALEEKVVEFGISQGLELLKASLWSNGALTAVFLLNQKVRDAEPSK